MEDNNVQCQDTPEATEAIEEYMRSYVRERQGHFLVDACAFKLMDDAEPESTRPNDDYTTWIAMKKYEERVKAGIHWFFWMGIGETEFAELLIQAPANENVKIEEIVNGETDNHLTNEADGNGAQKEGTASPSVGGEARNRNANRRRSRT